MSYVTHIESSAGRRLPLDQPCTALPGEMLAVRYDLDFHGTVWVLQQLYQLELLSSALGNCFNLLRSRGVRLPWEMVNELLVSVGEEPLKT